MEQNCNYSFRDFSDELIFSASRSGGPGGQNVNKVSTKVELRFHINNSQLLTLKEKLLINEQLTNKINQDGFLILVSQSERSQLMNKNKVIEKFNTLIKKAITLKKKRTRTSPTLASRRKRIEEKKKQGEKKVRRKIIDHEI